MSDPEEKDLCCICQDEQDLKPLVKSPNCQCREAIYHQECVDQYIVKTRNIPTCLICRTKFTKKNKVIYHLNYPVLYIYFMVTSISLLMEYFLPSPTLECFTIQFGFLFLLVTTIYYQEVKGMVYHFITVK